MPLPFLLRPFVDGVARVHTTVHRKLLGGFLVIALMLLGMGTFSIVVINGINRQIEMLSRQQQQVDLARQMIYSITGQSHYRAMALITQDDFWNGKVATAKESFIDNTNELEQVSILPRDQFFADIRATDERFAEAGQAVEELFDAGQFDQALQVHIAREHEISHELEDSLNAFIAESDAVVEAELADFQSSRQSLTYAVATVAGFSLLAALFLGAVLSWSLIRPVRKIDEALASISNGNFGERVHVPNRDEFGTLSLNINRTSEHLATLYQDLSRLNTELEQRVEDQLGQLERATSLKRYLSPQVADSILAGDARITLAPTRRKLTIFFSDIRGFTTMSERMEPEELVDALNQYLTTMTEIVFRHGGTLDKYMGDGIMVFIGDPIPYEDHAQRAVAMAFEMRTRVDEICREWFLTRDEDLTIGMGISTGYVTVGNMGSAIRSDYTVVGNHVNLAARLAARAEPGQILVSETSMVAVRDHVVGTPVDELSLKGVQRPVRIYEINERPAVVGDG